MYFYKLHNYEFSHSLRNKLANFTRIVVPNFNETVAVAT